MASASCIIPNTDISGIGVRTATYAQNILSFVPAFLALLDKKVSNEELDSLRGQSTTILLSAFALLIAAFIQAQNHANGLDNYHTTIVLNLSWMNNTNTFIYILFHLHHKSFYGLLGDRRLPDGEHTAGETKLMVPSGPTSKLDTQAMTKSLSSRALAVVRTHSPLLAKTIERVNLVVLIGSLHLSVMGALGIWLWFNPGRFGAPTDCSLTATTSLFGNTIPLSSPGLRAVSLVVYIIILIPGVNLIIPTLLFCTPLALVHRLGARADKKMPSSSKVGARDMVAIITALSMLMVINILFIVDTELSIARNESLQDRQDGLWTFGQTLALLLLVLPLRDLAESFSIIDGPENRPLFLALLSRAVNGLDQYSGNVDWEQVQKWSTIVEGTGEKVRGIWLRHAVQRRDWTMIHFAGVYHEDLNQQDKEGTTSLDYAFNYGHLDIAKYLIKKDARLDASGQFGKTSLHYASEGGHLEVIKYLVDEKSADINACDNNRQTSLHYASHNNHFNVVQYLAQNGVDINASDQLGKTGLHYACQKGHLKVVQYLVEKYTYVDNDEDSRIGHSNHPRGGHLNIVAGLGEKARMSMQVMRMAKLAYIMLLKVVTSMSYSTCSRKVQTSKQLMRMGRPASIHHLKLVTSK
ncbi:hypothetical protein B0H16DRAFT_58238 [Mycena metata]|uniref:Uncharacterized protein n=1 Tax=Mycena metata TaxID=1033252 RepID=A0AAD7N060_9AGAR|nr:hypothetical protein B0H16DRAFT_58238 [Mycena metata]